MRLDQIIHGMNITDRRGRMDCDIAGITFDSRRAQPGILFVAVRGAKVDGHKYIADALTRGAAAVLAEEWPIELDQRFPAKPRVVLVDSARRALAHLAANFYGQPSRKLFIAGVTGTNGKTTVTYVLESIIRAASRTVGVIGTVEARWGGRTVPVDHTTPDPVTLNKLLSEMSAAEVSHVVMEISSHALDQQRVHGLALKVAGFTNLTQDHLDYHQDMEKYFKAKSLLFSEILTKSRARGRMAVVNVDDPRASDMIASWGGKSLKVSCDPKSDADVVALEATYSVGGTKAIVKTPKGVWPIETSLIGAHNLSNALVAIGMALAMGFSRARIERGLRALERVPGRLDPVPSEEGKKIFVDYAHTPDALARVISALRPLTPGRVVVVFGCGGDRDKSKRKEMGRVVARLADLAIVTSDNPRTEHPKAIADMVEEGLRDGGWLPMMGEVRPKSYLVELDRRSAIRNAIHWITPNDVLIIAGKGHENYQIVGTEKRHFDDRDEARRILSNLPPPPPDVISFADSTGEVDTEQVVDAVDTVGMGDVVSERPSMSYLGMGSTMDLSVADIESVDADDAPPPPAAPVPHRPSFDPIASIEELVEEADDPPGDGKT